MTEKKYKYISIRNSEKYPKVYHIINNRSQESLGVIYYYPYWKQWVVDFCMDCVFNNACLRDILDFMENEIPKVRESHADET